MSNIEWTEQTWNVILGCDKISAGCQNCYAIQQAYRNNAIAQTLDPSKRGRLGYYAGLTEKRGDRTEWTGKIAFVEEALEIPLKRKKPTTYFVNSMGDLFHKNSKKWMLDLVFGVMFLTPKHTYQILTKRVDLMLDYLSQMNIDQVTNNSASELGEKFFPDKCEYDLEGSVKSCNFLLESFNGECDNIWLGTSLENQKAVNDRAPDLKKIKLKGWNTFYSCEPLLEEIDLHLDRYPVDWVICGAESGHGARPFEEDWARSLRDQCVASNVPFFYKQKVVGNKKISLPELDGQIWVQSPMGVIAS